MADAVISVATEEALRPLLDSISTQLGYIWNYKTNFENLEGQRQKLDVTQAQVQHSIDEAKRNGEEIEQKVVSWLDSVEKINVETTKIIEDNQRANMRCFKSLCPDLKKRYQHSKKAAVMGMEVSKLEIEGNSLGKVSYRTPPKETWHPSSKLYQDIESRRSTVENILNALRNPDINMVGVHGMGGIGKTTLAKEVGKQAEEQRRFDAVVFVEISEKPDIKKIQDAIADKLDLQFRENSESGRARALCERCKKESKLLIILDNIWKGLDLEIVGIPFANDHQGCKLLLTARSIDVLSNDMNSLKNFPVGELDEKEAWGLFKTAAGACIEQYGLQLLASEVAKRCGGLPIAIVTIAKALKDKQEHEWKNALRELKRPSSENLVGSVTAEAYSCIWLSYNQLNSDELKSTFLLCSIMGFTSNASVEELLRYGTGLSLFRTAYTMEEARDKVVTLVKRLRDSSLLLDTSGSEWFYIHDVVRDVGRAIALKDHNKFTVIDDVIPREWKDKNMLKKCTSISLHDISELPNMELNCPLLHFLYMKGKNENSKISDNFFIGMPNLRVLHLINMELSPYPPSSLGCLVNLQTLCLNCHWLRDIGFIADIKDLEILVLSCKIEQLPTEIGQLTQLRVLDLSKCYSLEIVPPSIISKLTQLEELYLDYGFDNWHVEGLDNESGNASLDELKHLSQLTTLHICIRDHKMVPKGLFSQQLQRYSICIGLIDQWDRGSRYGISKTLKLQSDDSIVIEDGVVMQLKGIEELRIDGRQSVKNALYELDSDGFPRLKHFDICNNPDLVYIVDSSKKGELPCNAFPLLETLSLTNLIGLEKICHGQITPISFCRLTTVNVDGCDNLKNVFSLSIAKHLSQLLDISLSDCKNMEDIFTIGRSNDINSNEEIDRVVLDQLHSLSLSTLPKLRSFCSEEEVLASTSNKIILEDTPMPFFDGKVQLPNLKTLKLYKVNFEKIWHHQLLIMSPCFQNLTHLSIQSCHNLKYLFSSCTFGSFVQLQDLEIKDCNVLEAIIRIDELGNHVEFPSLKKLKIQGCLEMKEFIFNDKVQLPNQYEVNFETIRHYQLPTMSHCFQNLTDLSVRSCNNLKYLFSFSTLRSFVQLQELEIKDCNVLEAIIRIDDLGNNELPSLMKKLKIEGCPEMKAFIFNDKVSFPNLEEIRISNMKNLEMIWHNQLIKDSMNAQHCQKLCKVEVSSCPSLKNLFPSSIARNLFLLKDLNVDHCGIEEIVAKDGAEDAAAMTFVFPQLTCLNLRYLQELKCFYSGIHTMECPVLKELILSDCDKIDWLFALELSVIQKNILEDQVDIPEQPLSLVEKVSSNLEKLSLDGNSSRMIFESQFPEILFPKLQHLSIENQKSSLLLGIFQRSTNLESLSLRFGGSYKETFLFDVVEKHIQTKKLSISEFDSLKQIWKQDSKVDVILEELHVSFCRSLVTLIPPSACFQNLTILRVRHCGGLLSSSTTKSLVGLKEMSIEVCQMMTEVVADDEGAITTEDIEIINFSKLESLQLSSLSRLSSFCSWNYRFNFPSLYILSVEDCPRMKIFASGVVLAPMLREIWLDGEVYYCEGDDVNRSMQQIHEKLVFSGESLSLSPRDIKMILQKFPELKFSRLKSLEVIDDESMVFPFEMLRRSHNLEQLKLKDGSYKEIFLFEEVQKHVEILSQLKSLDLNKLDHLEHMWKQDSKLDLILHNLETLQVRKCNSLISLVPDSASFQNLKTLTLYGCNSLISLMPDSVSFQNLKTLTLGGCNSLISLMPDSASFQNLKTLTLWNCNGLISLLSSSTAKSLVRLEKMSIRCCDMVTNIVATEDVEEDKIIIFSKLQSLILLDLSSLACFCSGNHTTLNFPSLESLYMRKCPKMKFFSLGVSSTPLLQGIKVSIDKSIWEGDLSTTIQRIHEELNPESSTKGCVSHIK